MARRTAVSGLAALALLARTSAFLPASSFLPARSGMLSQPWSRAASASRTGLRMVAAEPPVTPPKLDAMAAYVEKHGGSLPIRKILIANNGMAATKAILSMRQWCYLELGDEKAIEFVVMATPDDLAANAEFIRLSDGIVEVPGGSNRNNYANVDLIVEVRAEAEYFNNHTAAMHCEVAEVVILYVYSCCEGAGGVQPQQLRKRGPLC
eukprot:TRINITY_DN7039_c0_g2_i3.p1 TRINITY_DN7039_c0_g2~~TRINITY_DN7039_c0_g2_i3.p1  ORF type:complete len:208 (+),score=36.58 TRINITY_DN7039_c0_g2_i3:197-820(+)